MSDVTTKAQSSEKSDEKPAEEEPVTEQSEANGSETGDVVDEVEIEATSDEPLPDVPEGELPEDPNPPAQDPSDGDPSDMIDQPETADTPVLDGGDRPEAHDFTQTDAPPELIDPYDSVDTTNPWDSASDGANAPWGQDSLTDAGVDYEPMGDWNVYRDNSNGNAYTDYGNGSFEANVDGKVITGAEAEAAFQHFKDTRLSSPEQQERLRENAYNHSPANEASNGAWQHSTPPGEDTGGDVGGSDTGWTDEEQMGPPSSLAGGGETEHEIADFNNDGEIDWMDEAVDAVGRAFQGTTSREAQRIDKEMGGTGTDTSTRGEQEADAQKELDRQEKADKENKADKEDEQEDDDTTAAEANESEATDASHPGWGDGNRGGVSIFDSLKNQPGRTDPRDPGNIDPHEDGYGNGGTDATTASRDDLTQPAGPDSEPSGNGTFQPAPDPIDYGPDHIDPIGSGPYDDDPINMDHGTVSLNHEDPEPHEAPIEMADNGHPDLDIIGFGD